MYAVKDCFFVQEFYLRLGRVDIHVHRRGRQLQTQHAGGEFAHHKLIPVGLLQRRDQQPGLHRPVIHKEGL